jgi:hypothetical protein
VVAANFGRRSRPVVRVLLGETPNGRHANSFHSDPARGTGSFALRSGAATPTRFSAVSADSEPL